MDVVPADAERWTVPPFSGEIRDGYVWGRGATDMKRYRGLPADDAADAQALGRRARPRRLFLGTADEEEGSANGLGWMIEHHRDALRDAELTLTEGSYHRGRGGKTTAWNVDVTENRSSGSVVATGKAGHGSIPEPDGAVARLVRAVDRILAYRPPVRLIPAVDELLPRALAETAPRRRSRRIWRTRGGDPPPRRLARLTADPYRNACLRATISVTGLTGSDKVNVIPARRPRRSTAASCPATTRRRSSRCSRRSPPTRR